MQDLDKLRFPIGKFAPPQEYSAALINEWISDIRKFPEDLAYLLEESSEGLLEKTYRPGGWTVKQIIHHLADSHMNSFLRFKQALCEDNPTIMAYNENAWVATPEIAVTPANISALMLTVLHARWANLLEGMIEADWNRTFYHPEHKVTFELRFALALYAWHGKHHLAHIELALNKA